VGSAYYRSVARRYVLPCAVVMLLSLAAAGVVYLANRQVEYTSDCVFRTTVAASVRQAASSDVLTYDARLAARDVALASLRATADAARAAGVSRTYLDDHSRVQGSRGSTFTVEVVGPRSSSSPRLANGLCQAYVTRIQRQRASDRQAEAAAVTAQIATLQADVDRRAAVPAPSRADADVLAAEQAALARNQGLLVSALSQPPAQADVLIPATTTTRHVTRSLTRDAVVAVIAGLLLCFLVVLIGELQAERA
jgi:hypothetical protein